MTQGLARATYGRRDTELRDPRGLEYELLARATSALRNAEDGRQGAEQGDGQGGGREAGFPALVAAVDRNLRLWSALAADLASPENALPPELRARLFYLYEFTAQHSRSILDGNGSASVLVDINTAVMRGLRGGTAG